MDEQTHPIDDLIKRMVYEEKLQKFFSERIAIIKENKNPCELSSETDTRYIMHVVPDNYEELVIDIKQLNSPEYYFYPHGEHATHNIVPCFNFDGIVFTTSLHQKTGYAQVFRDSRIEVVIAAGKYTYQQGDTISLYLVQNNTVFRLQRYLSIYKQHAVLGPFTIYFRMIGMKDMKLSLEDITKSGYETKGGVRSITRDVLVLPPLRIPNTEVDVEKTLRPIFDILWNTFGYPGTPF